VLSEGDWKDFEDEKAVFNYIATKIKESLGDNQVSETKTQLQTEVEVLL